MVISFCFSYSLSFSCSEVFRFGQLSDFLISKSFPFWETQIGCKVTKYTRTNESFMQKYLQKKVNRWQLVTFRAPVRLSYINR